ncbi:MAG: caspase family protein [Arenicellales bacterium]
MSADQQQKKYALVVEIKNYEFLSPRIGDPSIPILRRTLQSEGFQVQFLNNGSRRNVLRAFNDLIYRVNANDVMMVVLSAGIVTTDRNEVVYIPFQDTRVNDIEYDGLSLRRLGDLLDEIRSENQLVALVLDTQGTKVRQSTSVSGSSLLQPTRTGLQSIVSKQLASLGEDRVVLSEVDARDEKTENADSLVRLLAKGLAGRADANGDSIVETKELQVYVEEKTSLERHVLAGTAGAEAEAPAGVLSRTDSTQTATVAVAPKMKVGKVIQTTPVTGTSVATKSIKLAKRADDNVVLTAEVEAQHKIVLAGWVVEGLIDRGDNFRLYALMSNMKGKNRTQVPKECYQYYKSLEPTLQDAYLMQDQENQMQKQSQSQVSNLVAAELVKQKLDSFPNSCTGK